MKVFLLSVEAKRRERERTRVWEERWRSGGGEHTNEESKGGKASGSILASLRLTRKSDFYSDFLFAFGGKEIVHYVLEHRINTMFG